MSDDFETVIEEIVYIDDYDYYILRKYTNGYSLMFYGNNNGFSFSADFYEKPVVEQVSKYLFKIINNNNQELINTFFYDISTNKLSIEYVNLLFSNDELATYINEQDKLVVQNIFYYEEEKDNLFYMEIESKFNSISDEIIDVKIVDNQFLEIKYYTGENKKEITEVIKIHIIQ